MAALRTLGFQLLDRRGDLTARKTGIWLLERHGGGGLAARQTGGFGC